MMAHGRSFLEDVCHLLLFAFLLLQVSDPAALQHHLEELLATPLPPSKHMLTQWRMQHKIEKAVKVFGMDRLVARLYPYITGKGECMGDNMVVTM
jgi:hypothetical protein